MATNLPVVGLTVSAFQFAELGRAPAATHVMPSFEYEAAVEPDGTATNRPVVGLTTTPVHAEELGKGLPATQLIPSLEYADDVENCAMATYLTGHDVPVPPAYTFARVPSYVAAI